MLKEAYEIIKKQLQDEVPELKLVDWDLNQDAQVGDTHLKATPAALISFLPVDLRSQTQKLQRGQLKWRVRLISLTRYGDERDMTDTLYINHLAIETKIYQALHSRSFLLSFLPAYAGIDPTLDRVILGNISRMKYQPHGTINNLISTWQEFSTDFCDITAMTIWQTIQASLQVDFEIVDEIELDA